LFYSYFSKITIQTVSVSEVEMKNAAENESRLKSPALIYTDYTMYLPMDHDSLNRISPAIGFETQEVVIDDLDLQNVDCNCVNFMMAFMAKSISITNCDWDNINANGTFYEDESSIGVSLIGIYLSPGADYTGTLTDANTFTTVQGRVFMLSTIGAHTIEPTIGGNTVTGLKINTNGGFL